MASSARIEELERKFNENPRRYFAPLANEYRKAGDLEQAIAICRTYVPQQPAHMSGHIVFGQALFEAGEHEEARGVFEAALALDPENLIALRHLGDIARERGETTAARTWYQRVLDADPRNDEVTALLVVLDGSSNRDASGGVATWAEINPERTLELPPGLLEGVTREAVIGDAQAARKTPAFMSPPAPVNALEQTLQPPPPTSAREGWPHPTPVLPDEIPGPGFLDVEQIDTPTLQEPLSPAAASAPPPMAPAVPDIDSGPAIAGATAEATDAGTHAPETETHAPETETHAPEAETQAVEVPEAESPEVEPSEVPPVASQEDMPIGGLEPMEFVAPPRPETPPIAAAPAPSSDAQDATRSADATPAVFVTETMAELYLQQGFRDEALGVYRQLLAQAPDDAVLRARVEQLEATERSATPGSGVPSVTPDLASVSSEATSSLPTIRDFFAALASRPWVATQGFGAPTSDAGGEMSSPPADHASEGNLHHGHALVETAPPAAAHEPSRGSGEDWTNASETAGHPTDATSSAADSTASGVAVADAGDPDLDVAAMSTETMVRESITVESATYETGGDDSSPLGSFGGGGSLTAFASTEYDVASYDAADMSGILPVGGATAPATPVPVAPPPNAEAPGAESSAAESSAAESSTPASPVVEHPGAAGSPAAEANATGPATAAAPTTAAASPVPDPSAAATLAPPSATVEPSPAGTEINGTGPSPSPRKAMQTGSVNVLFPQTEVRPADETAAATLSDAFGGPTQVGAVAGGHPARPATNELSLDSIFREAGPPPSEPRREASAFSFDQFFTDTASQPSPSPAPSNPGPGSPRDTAPIESSDSLSSDAEQFSNWLAGLKKK
jgi:hypothetical protein